MSRKPRNANDRRKPRRTEQQIDRTFTNLQMQIIRNSLLPVELIIIVVYTAGF